MVSALAAGEIIIFFLGNEFFCHHVTVGRAIESVRSAEKFCESGDVILSPSAWVHCASLKLITELIDDGKHRKASY